jgi:hypothetical protein
MEEKLARIAALRSAAPQPPSLAADLRPFLGDAAGAVVAFAAKVARERSLAALSDDLQSAFFRLLDDVKGDPGCRGKLAAAEALRDLELYAPDVFARGVGYSQLEPAFGGRNDTAGQLRVCCGAGLLQVSHPHAMLEVAGLLADAEPNVRAGAAALLGAVGTEAAEALLRLKALLGDDEPDVTGACLEALVRVSFARSLPLVLRAIDGDDDGAVAQTALLALGASREEAAIAPLRERAETAAIEEVRSAAFLGLSLLRAPAATQYLLETIERASEGRALDAVAALSSQRHDEALAKTVDDLVRARGGRVLDAYRRSWAVA